MNKQHPSIDDYRHRLSPFQKELLEEIWQPFRKMGLWTTLRELYSKYGKEKVRDALSPLKANIGREERGSGPWTTYQLSLLGALITKEGQAFQELLAKFLAFQRESFQKHPLRNYFSCDDIRQALNLTDAEVSLLGQLLALGHISGSTDPVKTWGASAMDQAEDFPAVGQLSGELDQLVFKYYDADLPAFEDERRRHSPTPSPLLSALMQSAPSTDSPSSVPIRTIVKNTAFIMMSMDKSHPELEDVLDAIKEVCREFNIEAFRADDIQHQDRITDVILQRIRESEFLIADLSGEKPNVYYEVGYAHALDLRPILFRKEGTKLHFDLYVHNVPDYRNARDLKEKLRSRFESMLGRESKAATKNPSTK